MNLLEKLDFKRRIDAAADEKGEPSFFPGDKVKLNYKRIKRAPNYKRKRTDWKMFVGRHRDDMFTVEYDPKYGPSPSVVCFTEDKHDPKWLWAMSDLMPYNESSSEKV